MTWICASSPDIMYAFLCVSEVGAWRANTLGAEDSDVQALIDGGLLDGEMNPTLLGFALVKTAVPAIGPNGEFIRAA